MREQTRRTYACSRQRSPRITKLVVFPALLIGMLGISGCFLFKSTKSDGFRFQSYYESTVVNPSPKFDPLHPKMEELFEGTYDDRDILTVESAFRDWKIIRHEISGAITQRVTRAWVGFQMKNKPTHCEKELRSYYQDHFGGDKWSELKLGRVFIGSGGEVGGPIPCSELGESKGVEVAGNPGTGG